MTKIKFKDGDFNKFIARVGLVIAGTILFTIVATLGLGVSIHLLFKIYKIIIICLLLLMSVGLIIAGVLGLE